mmetsp:Transcript_12193/g.35022  ORF Transcript_12193/g.35022 Transcript_12193/m.35022 type:complete len:317 (-) Transcript_12193:194-1144(-)
MHCAAKTLCSCRKSSVSLVNNSATPHRSPSRSRRMVIRDAMHSSVRSNRPARKAPARSKIRSAANFWSWVVWPCNAISCTAWRQAIESDLPPSLRRKTLAKRASALDDWSRARMSSSRNALVRNASIPRRADASDKKLSSMTSARRWPAKARTLPSRAVASASDNISSAAARRASAANRASTRIALRPLAGSPSANSVLKPPKMRSPSATSEAAQVAVKLTSMSSASAPTDQRTSFAAACRRKSAVSLAARTESLAFKSKGLATSARNWILARLASSDDGSKSKPCLIIVLTMRNRPSSQISTNSVSAANCWSETR